MNKIRLKNNIIYTGLTTDFNHVPGKKGTILAKKRDQKGTILTKEGTKKRHVKDIYIVKSETNRLSFWFIFMKQTLMMETNLSKHKT